METQRQRKKLNIIMGALIAVVMLCGVMAVGNLKGWFGGGDIAIACDGITGVVNIERDGVAYSMKEGQRIESGDIVETKTGSEVVLKLVEANSLTMNENTELSITEGRKDSIKLELVEGEIFADMSAVPETFEITFGENKADITGTVFSISMQQGSAFLNVYEGEVQVVAEDGKEHTVVSGKTISMIHSGDGTLEVKVAELSAEALSNFILEKAQSCNSADKLCFALSALQKIAKERDAENEQAMDGKGEAISAEDTSGNAGSGSGSKSKSDGTTSGSSGEGKFCTIQIRCDTILNNKGNLKAGKDRYVPSNGVILATSTVEFRDGETVFDVLKRACNYTGIQLEYSYTPLYESYYIEGINNLYEFDCGPQSGWMYKVNGWFPNYGCSNYTLKNGDNIVWTYTCNGLGADVGGNVR